MREIAGINRYKHYGTPLVETQAAAMQAVYLQRQKKLNTKTTNKISGTLSKDIDAAIKSKDKVSFNLINNDKQSPNTTFDSYKSGNVDMKDLEKIKDNAFLAGTIGHFLTESMQQPDISKRDPSNQEGKDAHQKGLDKEGQIVREMHGITGNSTVEKTVGKQYLQYESGPNKGQSLREWTYDYGEVQYKILRGETPIYGRDGFQTGHITNGIIYSVTLSPKKSN